MRNKQTHRIYGQVNKISTSASKWSKPWCFSLVSFFLLWDPWHLYFFLVVSSGSPGGESALFPALRAQIFARLVASISTELQTVASQRSGDSYLLCESNRHSQVHKGEGNKSNCHFFHRLDPDSQSPKTVISKRTLPFWQNPWGNYFFEETASHFWSGENLKNYTLGSVDPAIKLGLSSGLVFPVNLVKHFGKNVLISLSLLFSL